LEKLSKGSRAASRHAKLVIVQLNVLSSV
jgi:hypothetical protein